MMRARRPPQGLLPPSRLVLGLLSLLSLLLLPSAAGGTNTEARVAFSNEGSVDLEVFWRHPQTKQYSLLATIEKGAGRDINTFQGHEFFLAAAGLGTPPAIVEPNFVQKEAGEDVSVGRVLRGWVGGWPHLGRMLPFHIHVHTRLFIPRSDPIQYSATSSRPSRGGAGPSGWTWT